MSLPSWPRFPVTASVPLIGAPATIHSAAVIVVVTCNCDAKTPILLNGFVHIAQCPACKRKLQIKSFSFDNLNPSAGQIEVVEILAEG